MSNAIPEFCPVVVSVVAAPLIVRVGARLPFALLKLVKTEIFPLPGSAT
jgi:hypothetical protein